MRVLMVIPIDEGSKPKVWMARQIDSLEHLGVVVKAFPFQNRRSLRGLIAGGLALRQKAREFGADLVHVHYGAAQALIAVLFSSKPVIISFCGSDLLGNYNPDGRKTWIGLLSRVLSQFAVLGCRRSIAKSRELKESLWGSWSRNRCDVVPNGVSLDTFRPIPQLEARAALGWMHDDPVVLFMDRKGAWVKDPVLAHSAYSEAKKTVRSLRMHVVESESHDKMRLFYNAADVLLITSHHEGSNNTVKEALACNLPVVATACGDLAERLNGVHCCFVCSRNAHALGSQLARVVSTRKRSNGREHIQPLALERVAMKIKGCYEIALLSP